MARKQGDCIVCDTFGPITRGLCDKHYNAYYAEQAKMSDADAKRFEADLVSQGLLLPRGKPGRQPDKDNVFREIAAKYKTSKSKETDSINEQIDAAVKRARSKKKPLKKKKPNKKAE